MVEENNSAEKLYNLKKIQKRESEIKFLEYIKNRLKSIAKKKFTTCFIFAISEFEKVWGQELWGHGLPDEKLTDVQRANRVRWEQVRRDILDKGNNQLRGFESEIDLHNIDFKGYTITFVGNKGDKNGTN